MFDSLWLPLLLCIAVVLVVVTIERFRPSAQSEAKRDVAPLRAKLEALQDVLERARKMRFDRHQDS